MATQKTFKFRIEDQHYDIPTVTGLVVASTEISAMSKVYENHLMLGKHLVLEEVKK